MFPKECFTTRTYSFRSHFRAHDKHRGDYTKFRFVVTAFDNSKGLIYIFCMPTPIFLSIFLTISRKLQSAIIMVIMASADMPIALFQSRDTFSA